MKWAGGKWTGKTKFAAYLKHFHLSNNYQKMAGNSTSPSSRTSVHQQSFVFGSSTPRELTHINTVSKRERMIDTHIKPDTDSKDVQRKGIVF
jgi:hypothetical protein